MAICPVHGVDHEAEAMEKVAEVNAEVADPTSDTAKELEESQSRLFKVLTDFPLDHNVVDISDNVRVHFLDDSRVTEDMRRDVIRTLRSLEEMQPSQNGADVYFPVPAETLLRVNPKLNEATSSIPKNVLMEKLRKQPDGQTFFVLQHNYFDNNSIDAERTITDSNRILFLYEGLINAERLDPYSYPEDSNEAMLRMVAKMLGAEEEEEDAPPKRPKKMFLAWSIFVPLIYHLVHEWGHVLDTRDSKDRFRVIQYLTELRDSNRAKFNRVMDDMSHSAMEGGDREAYGESWVEWVATNGATQNQLAVTYAQTYNWPTALDWDFPHDVRDFKNEPTIDPNSVISDNNPFAI